MTLEDLNIQAAQRADVEQAAYFRSELEAERQLLLAASVPPAGFDLRYCKYHANMHGSLTVQ